MKYFLKFSTHSSFLGIRNMFVHIFPILFLLLFRFFPKIQILKASVNFIQISSTEYSVIFFPIVWKNNCASKARDNNRLLYFREAVHGFGLWWNSQYNFFELQKNKKEQTLWESNPHQLSQADCEMRLIKTFFHVIVVSNRRFVICKPD